MNKRVEIRDGRKRCPRCKEWKDLETEYNSNKSTPHKKQYICKICANKAERKARKKDPEAYNAYHREYRAKNPERISAINRRNHLKYKERKKEATDKPL